MTYVDDHINSVTHEKKTLHETIVIELVECHLFMDNNSYKVFENFFFLW